MKAGTAECFGCNNRFDKPEMREITWTESSGYSVGIFGGILGNRTGKGGSVREYFRKKRGWLCDKCHAARKRIAVSLLLLVFGGLLGAHAFYSGRYFKGFVFVILSYLGVEFIAVLLGDLYLGIVSDLSNFSGMIASSSALVDEPWRFVSFAFLCILLFLDLIDHVFFKIVDKQGLPYKL